jgi:hypothetical protein
MSGLSTLGSSKIWAFGAGGRFLEYETGVSREMNKLSRKSIPK